MLLLLLQTEAQRSVDAAASVTSTSGYHVGLSHTKTLPGQQQFTIWTTTSSERSQVVVEPTAASLISASTINLATVALATTTTTTTTTTHEPRAVVLTNAVVTTTSIAVTLTIATIVCVVWTIGRYYFGGRHWHPAAVGSSPSACDETDNLLDEVARIYWREIEPLIDDTLRFVDIARQTTIFRSVTAYDVFAYKFRTVSGGVASTSTTAELALVGDDDVCGRNVGVDRGPFVTLRKVEHVFELMTLCLPPTACLEADEIRATEAGNPFDCLVSLLCMSSFLHVTMLMVICIIIHFILW